MLKKKILVFITVLACTFQSAASVAAASDQEAMQLMSEMSHALRESTYQGRFVYIVNNKQVTSFQIQHTIIDNLEHERLVFLNKGKEEVVRVGHEIYCLHPGNHMLRQTRGASSNPFADKFMKLGKDIDENYQIEINKGVFVAGRESIEIVFRAKDDNRYDHHIWVDANEKLLLKVKVVDPVLGALESFEFIELTTGLTIPKSEFDHKDFVRHIAKHYSAEQKAQGQGENWQTGWLPMGFYMTGEESKVIQNKNPVYLMMYTDGLAAITVFVEKVEKLSQFNESSQLGALSAYSYSPSISANVSGKASEPYTITVVGDITIKAAERIAKSVVLKTP